MAVPRRQDRPPQSPLAYRVLNFLVCSVLSWVVLLGIASIEHTETRLAVAGAIAASSSVVGWLFQAMVDAACQRAARDEVNTMLDEARALTRSSPAD